MEHNQKIKKSKTIDDFILHCDNSVDCIDCDIKGFIIRRVSMCFFQQEYAIAKIIFQQHKILTLRTH